MVSHKQIGLPGRIAIIGVLAGLVLVALWINHNLSTAVLMKNLHSPSANKRRFAAERLAATKQTRFVLPILKVAVDDPVEEVSEVAEKAIVEMGRPAVKPLYEALLRETVTYRQEEIAQILARVGDEGVTKLVIALNSKRGSIRAAATKGLSCSDSESAIGPLVNMLKDHNEDVRRAAVYSLGRIGTHSVVVPLIGALRDEDYEVHKAVGVALSCVNWDDKAVATARDALNADAILVANAYGLLIQAGIPTTEPILAAALKRYGSKNMASAFVNSGNNELSDAAYAWAEKNGYQVMPLISPDSPAGPQWGTR